MAIDSELIHNDGLPADDQEREDVARLVHVAANHGKMWTDCVAFAIWEKVSADCGAGWLQMPDADDDVWRWVTGMCLERTR